MFKPFDTVKTKYIAHGKASHFYAAFALVSLVITYAFYASPIRDLTEDFFYDLRTNLKPSLVNLDRYIIVDIDEESIKSLTGGRQNLSVNQLVDLSLTILNGNPQELTLLYFSNIFNYQDKANLRFANMVRADPRITVATLGLNFAQPFLLDFPELLLPIKGRMAGVDPLRKRSNSTVRSLPYVSYRGTDIAMQLPLYLKQKLGVPVDLSAFGKGRHFRINYRRAGDFRIFKASQVARDGFDVQVFRNKIVLLGYSAYREWPAQTFDPMLVNTPLQGNTNNFKDGAPILYITAMGMENVIEDRVLAEAPFWANSLQILIICIFILFLWRRGSVVGSVGTLALGSIVLVGQALLMELGSVFLPAADAFLFGSFALIIGSFSSLQKELSDFAKVKTKLNNERDIEQLQSHVLDRFASEVSTLNRQLSEEAVELQSLAEDAMDAKLIMSLRQSTEEFEDFLQGIKQLATVSESKVVSLVDHTFNIKACADKIIERFDQIATKKNIVIKNMIEPDLTLDSVPEIIDTILYNFISNAVKYSPDDKEVIVGIKFVGRRCELYVSDEGPGIAPEFQERVFEKFYRVKDDNVYRIKGTGIGLYLAKFFAEKIGGSVGLQSTVGKGTTFYLRLENRS